MFTDSSLSNDTHQACGYRLRVVEHDAINPGGQITDCPIDVMLSAMQAWSYKPMSE
jgi:hypothetical protein